MKAMLPSPSVCWSAFRQTCSMSSSHASSLHIKGLQVAQDVLAPDIVLARFHQPALDQIHGPTEERLQLLFHRKEIIEAPRYPRGKRDEEIHIAVRPEIFA